MRTSNDIHQQFADYFGSEKLKPFTYLLSRRLSEGHICLPLHEISTEETEKVHEIYKTKLPPIEELKKEPLVQSSEVKQPFIIHNEKMYFQRYYAYETLILQKINAFISTEKKAYAERVHLLKQQKDLIKKLSKKSEDAAGKTDWQMVAVINTVLNNFSIITGGPGTGKTTTVAKILSLLFNADPGLKVSLAAPTGKAAARMAESLKNAHPGNELPKENLSSLVPTTIHRLLKTIRGTHYFKHNSENLLDFDVIIIDESSMIDTALFAKLLDAISPETRLILLGDKDQLASVEAGSLFGDLCNALSSTNQLSKDRIDLVNSLMPETAFKLPVNNSEDESQHPLFQHIIELKESHRFKDEEGIGKFSKAVIEDNVSVLDSFFENNFDKQVQVQPQQDENLFKDFISGYASYIQETDTVSALEKLNCLRVLCAVKEGEQGVYHINRKIENYLQQKRLIRITGEFYENRPVMVTGNNYELELFNGDVGIIRKNADGIAMAWFENGDGTLKPVLPAFISRLETVYAMTIHKSQGSEFNKVMVVLPDNEEIAILTRELLYTAVTRAKEKVIVVGKKEVILNAAKRKVKRTSGICERFAEK